MAATTVYLIVHELFGTIFDGRKIELVTPVVPTYRALDGREHEHQYRIGRFKEGKWNTVVKMRRDEKYKLCGVFPRLSVATNVPCHTEFSPHPPGKLELDPENKPYCTWSLPLPKHIHQLRLVSIRDCDRPIFTGDPHGDAVDAQLRAISLAQAFEYVAASPKDVGIVDSKGKVDDLDYTPDGSNTPPTINLHLWAQLEDELGMTDDDADKHAALATSELVALFKGLAMQAKKSLSINDWYSTQVQMPLGIRFPELMTLAEKFALPANRGPEVGQECTGRTCGQGGNLFVSAYTNDALGSENQ